MSDTLYNVLSLLMVVLSFVVFILALWGSLRLNPHWFKKNKKLGNDILYRIYRLNACDTIACVFLDKLSAIYRKGITEPLSIKSELAKDKWDIPISTLEDCLYLLNKIDWFRER